ncbi:MAG: hypothetical protein WAR24_01655 [Candidatus Acidiferrales bacterium]
MTPQSQTESPAKRRRNALRIFYVFVLIAIVTLSFAVRPNQSRQKALIALGIIVAGGAVWSFFRFLRAADDLQKDINYQATSFAFVGSLLLTLIVGLLQRFGFLSGASLLVPALMIGLWSVALIFSSWRYQ